MDSPAPSKSLLSSSSAAASTSSPVQESPFTNYVRSLSPIKHDKSLHLLPAFVGLNSPPLVFTSPRINALRRPQSSNVEVCQNGEDDKKNSDAPCSLKESVIELQQGLIADTDIKEVDASDSVQPSSSSGCVDEYLADHVEADCENSAQSIDSNVKQPSCALQPSVNGLLDTNDQADSTQILSGQSEEGLERELTFDIEAVKSGEEQHAGQKISDECPKFACDVFDRPSQERECRDLDTQKEVENHGEDCDHFSQRMPESLEGVQADEDFSENVGVADVTFNNMTQDVEASEHRGMSRRCLQFGEAQPKATTNCSNSSNLSNDMNSSRLHATISEVDGLSSCNADVSAISGKTQLVNLSQLAINMIPLHHGEKSSTVSKPSGIGLHLNSIVNSIPMSQGGTASVKMAVSSLGFQKIKSASKNFQSIGNIEGCYNAFENASVASQDGTLEAKASVVAGSATSESICTVESIDHTMTSHPKRELSSEHGDSNEMSNQQSPKKKRKKSSSSTDVEGCKRCNCKKTKCLKLYCDCFAAGIYCSDPCSCQGCFNKPEHENMVIETRQQIESRNPLAFAPKIVQPDTEFPVNSREDGNWKTPSSARHKRGCNCKRSMCLKKYCECYQANVGCSIGCRCEGCKNVFGKKEDYCLTEEMMNRGSGEVSESKLTTKKDLLLLESCDLHHLTPITPSIQWSDQGRNDQKSMLISRRNLPSPESDAIILSCTKSPRTSDSSDELLETSKENFDIGPYPEGINYNNADMPANEFHCSPLLDHPSAAVVSSSSKGHLTSLSRFQLGPRSGCLSSGSSLQWQSSPVTPALGGTKNLPGLDSDGGLYGILEDDTETPEILKDSSIPDKPVKASSPNGKRVSPPQHFQQLGSSSSVPLKSGRKFILKAVPCFPPLTPCIDSKSRSNQSISNFKENSSHD